MKHLFALTLALCTSLHVGAARVELQVGDILLQPLNCRVCSLIEGEEESPYSHMGLVLSVNPVMVAEAWGSVVLTDVKDFVKKTERGQNIKVLRFRRENISRVLNGNQQKYAAIFFQDFHHRKYDEKFSWHNLDENEEEKYYCSELVSKLLQAFIGLETPIKRMHFNQNREQWYQYFEGNIPDGQWGNSPADFEKSDLFYAAGEL